MWNGTLKGYVGVALGAAIVALVIRSLVFETYKIPTATMHPTLEPGDLIFVAKWPYGLRFPIFQGALFGGKAPGYGEVIVFANPGQSSSDSIRRVIGLPGDRVELRKGRVVLNGAELPIQLGPDGRCGLEGHPKSAPYEVCVEEPWIEDRPEVRVPEGSIFVLGDYRKELSASYAAREVTRSWSIVPFDLLRARALRVWLSIDPSGIRTNRWFPRIRRERLFKKIQ